MQHLPGKSIGAQQGALAFADLGDVLLIHFRRNAERLWFANPKQGRGGIHNLPYLCIAAQDQTGGGCSHHVIIKPALRRISRGAHLGIQFFVMLDQIGQTVKLGGLRGPFNLPARRAAGFDEDELRALEP
jgi:hypothetical protein